VQREDIEELHYIAPIENVESILELGILSHNRAAKVRHKSVAMEEVQVRRQDKRIPGAGRLHDYVNLYFDAHNPMLSKVRDRNTSICVLRVSPEVLDLQGVIVSDRNAARGYAKFFPVADGLVKLDGDLIFAQYWIHQDEMEYERRKALKCAEALVPGRVEPSCIVGAYVCNESVVARWQERGLPLPVSVKPNFFF